MRCNRAVAFWRVPRCAVVVVAVATVMAGCGSGAASSPSGSASTKRLTGRTALANAAAFAGHGELAFVSRGTLWVLDGATQTLRRVATPGVTPLDPAFSPDGHWLAFLGSGASASAQSDTV